MGKTEVFASQETGSRITASYVSYLPDGNIVVGDAAKNSAANNVEGTIYDIKRFIGRKFSDPSV